MQILGEVPEGSGADAEVRFRKVHTYFRLRRGKEGRNFKLLGIAFELIFCNLRRIRCIAPNHYSAMHREALRIFPIFDHQSADKCSFFLAEATMPKDSS